MCSYWKLDCPLLKTKKQHAGGGMGNLLPSLQALLVLDVNVLHDGHAESDVARGLDVSLLPFVRDGFLAQVGCCFRLLCAGVHFVIF